MEQAFKDIDFLTNTIYYKYQDWEKLTWYDVYTFVVFRYNDLSNFNPNKSKERTFRINNVKNWQRREIEYILPEILAYNNKVLKDFGISQLGDIQHAENKESIYDLDLTNYPYMNSWRENGFKHKKADDRKNFNVEVVKYFTGKKVTQRQAEKEFKIIALNFHNNLL